ncbi:MAG: hypothetical protein AAF585_14805 [Verrucomicrobiota bacterium]
MLSFKISDTHGGLAKSEGLIKAEDEQLLVEFQTSDNIAGVIKSDVKKIAIPFEDIAEIDWKRGFFGGKLFLEFKSMDWLASFPRTHDNRAVLEISRRNRDKAAEFVKDLRYSLMSDRLGEMLDTIDSVDPLRD